MRPWTLTRVLAGQVSPGGEVVGVDLAAGMIGLARASAPANVRFETMDMEQLGFADASFDAAACGHGLQFATDLARALSEARRVLRPGGVFAASVPAGWCERGRLGADRRGRRPVAPARPAVVDEGGHAGGGA